MLLSGLVLGICLSAQAQQAKAPVPLYTLLHQGSGGDAAEQAAQQRALEAARQQLLELQRSAAQMSHEQPKAHDVVKASHVDEPDGTHMYVLDHGAPAAPETPPAADSPTTEPVSPEVEAAAKQLQQQSARMQQALQDLQKAQAQ